MKIPDLQDLLKYKKELNEIDSQVNSLEKKRSMILNSLYYLVNTFSRHTIIGNQNWSFSFRGFEIKDDKIVLHTNGIDGFNTILPIEVPIAIFLMEDYHEQQKAFQAYEINTLEKSKIQKKLDYEFFIKKEAAKF